MHFPAAERVSSLFTNISYSKRYYGSDWIYPLASCRRYNSMQATPSELIVALSESHRDS